MKTFLLLSLLALAGCAERAPMTDEQRALMGQYIMNQQRINAQNYQTQMQSIQANRPQQPVQTNCTRYGNQISCTSN
jgi:hypothetical protein